MIVPSRSYKTSDKVDYAKVFSNNREYKKWLFEQDVEKEMKWHEVRLQEKWDNEYYECLNKVRRLRRYSIWKEKHPEEARKEERRRHLTLWFESFLPCIIFVGILWIIAYIVNDFILDGFHYAGYQYLSISDSLFCDVFRQDSSVFEVIFPPAVSFLMYAILRWKFYKDKVDDGYHPAHLVCPTLIMCVVLWGIEINSNFLLPTVFFLTVVLLFATVPILILWWVVDAFSNPEDDRPYKRIDFLDK